MMQFLSAIPLITEFAYLSRDSIMTYLHLSFLGFTSCFLVGLLIMKNYLSTSSLISKIGYLLFLIGTISMEVTIGLRSIPQYLTVNLYNIINNLLLIESIILFVSVFIMLFFGFILSNRAIKHRSLS